MSLSGYKPLSFTIIVTAILGLFASTFLQVFIASPANAAIYTASFANSGSSIKLSGAMIKGTATLMGLPKTASYTAAAEVYKDPSPATGSLHCMATITITFDATKPPKNNKTDGTISFKPGPGNASPGGTEQCTNSNLPGGGSIVITGAREAADKPDKDEESDADRTIDIVVYLPAGDYPAITGTVGKSKEGSIAWNDGEEGVGRVSFDDLNPGEYRVCVKSNKDLPFDETCQMATKKKGKALTVEFGDKSTAGKDVDSDDKEGEGEESKCQIDGGLGWILCPIFNLIGGISDAAYNLVALMLTVPPIMTNGDSKGVYDAWKSMRNVANVAFVIAFLLIIFSQVTSIGFSNYNIKKMVPRLVMAAILVNISFWVCALAVDASNILGSSIKAVFDGMSQGIGLNDNKTFWNSEAEYGGPSFAAIVLYVIGGAAAGAAAVVVAGGFMAALAALVPMLIAVFIAIVTVFVVLTARQALIILLIVISPLAFVAMLLPNTENWFTRWRQLFQVMLLMFPIIAGIFGASSLAAIVIMNSTDNVAVQILGAGVAVVPLALTPIVMKTAGGMLNKIGAVVNNPNRGPLDKIRNSASEYQKRRATTRANNSRAARLEGNTRLGKVSSRMGKNKNRFVRGLGRGVGAADAAAVAATKHNQDTKDEERFSGIRADAAARNYSNKMAVGDGSMEGIEAGKKYAMKVAGGNQEVATLVQAYGAQAVREEDAKDIKAERALIEYADFDTLMNQLKNGNSATSRAAAMAEIRTRTGGDENRAALDYAATIDNEQTRRLVQQEYINNKGPEMFGLGHNDKSALASGNYGRGEDGKFDGSTYDQKLAARLETKASGETIASLSPHDINNMERLAKEGDLSKEALSNVTNAIAEARSNPNTNARIKAGDQLKLDNVIVNQQNGNYAGSPSQKLTQEIKHTGQETLKISHEVANASQGNARPADVSGLTKEIDKASQSIDRANKAMDQKIAQQAAQQKARENLGYQDRS